MIKTVVPFFLILLQISCRPPAGSADYLGQAYPDSIPIIFASDIISIKGRLEHGISFTPDGQELAFGVLDKDDLSGKIFYSKQTERGWTEPAIFQPLETESVYLPYFSPDGRYMLYAQSKPDTDNINTDIWAIEKINGIWSIPKPLEEPINSTSREANACMTSDGTIYFSSNRNCDGIEGCHTADLFFSKLRDNKYQSVEAISRFTSPNDEESVFISPKEEYIIFCRYTGGETGVDLYISYQNVNRHWTDPRPVDSTINSKDWERRPFVSLDNKYLFFTRLQVEETGLTESDIFWVNTSKLFKPFVYNSLSDVTVQVGKKFEISIPKDYFKHINDEQLTYRINKYEWLHFDSEHMKLSGVPPMEGDFDLIFTVTDQSSNMTVDKIMITVKK